MSRCEYRQCDEQATIRLTIEERYADPPSHETGPYAVSTRVICAAHRDVMLSRRDDEDEVGDGL